MPRVLKTILYIEDEPDIQTVAKLALELVGGYTLLTANSGPEGLRLFQQKRPDLVLLDVMMPGLDGTQTLAALRQLPEGAAQPVVFMTAKAQPSELQYYLSLGALGVIQKPFDPMNLAHQVAELWSKL